MSTSDTRSFLRRATATIATAALLIVGLGSFAAPAQADAAVLLTGAQNGTAGVPQTLGIVVTDPDTPCGSVLATPPTITGNQGGNSSTLGQGTFTACSGTSYQYTFRWVPSIADVWYVAASWNGFGSNAIRAAISPVATSISLTGPSTARLGAPTTLTATVTAASGSELSAPGSVQFSVVGGGNIGSPVNLNGALPAQASTSWVPGALGQVSVVATYIPGRTNGVISTTCGNSCVSNADSVQVTQYGVNLFLSNPPQFFVGTPNTITAVVGVTPPSGSVSFFVNGQTISANVPVQSNGQAATSWTPPTTGTFTISANWIGNNGASGSSQETITVGGGTGLADSIILTPVGQASWTAGGTYPVANGTTLTFTGASTSGAPVSISDKGPCNVSGMSLTADQGNGGCILTATTPGGNGFGPGNATYTIQLVPGTQVPATNPPASGRFPAGRVLTLERANQQDTNAGQMINWRVRPNSRSICQLRFPNSGAVTLRLIKRGACNIVGRAPAIAGQWNKMEITRSYQVR